MKRVFWLALAAVWMASGHLAADLVITQWNFNSLPDDGLSTTGTLTPNVGTGAINLVGGTSATFAGGTLSPSQSSDPDQGLNNSAWNVTGFSLGTNLAMGIEARVSTLGYSDIRLTWDQRHSNTSSKFIGVMYTLDGSTWTQFTNAAAMTAGTLSGTPNPGQDTIDASGLIVAGGGDRFFNGRAVDFSGIAGANDNPNFGIRIVAAFDPSSGSFVGSNGAFSTNGTQRFDLVTLRGNISAIPEPSSLALSIVAIAGGLGLTRRNRR